MQKQSKQLAAIYSAMASSGEFQQQQKQDF